MASPETISPEHGSHPHPHVVTLHSFNSIKLEHDEVYHLVTKFCGSYLLNILNLGPCTVYYRADADPHVNDPDSVTLPPGTADNKIFVADGPMGLLVRAGPPCACMVVQHLDDNGCMTVDPRPIIGQGATISVRLMQA